MLEVERKIDAGNISCFRREQEFAHLVLSSYFICNVSMNVALCAESSCIQRTDAGILVVLLI